MPLFRWEEVDHRLVSLKLTDLAEEMHKQIEQDEKRIRFENQGNLNRNAVPSLVLKMKQDRADDMAYRSRVELRPIYSVPLSIFEATVGKLMVQARQGCPTKYLPHCEILKIATLLDDENLPVRTAFGRRMCSTASRAAQGATIRTTA